MLKNNFIFKKTNISLVLFLTLVLISGSTLTAQADEAEAELLEEFLTTEEMDEEHFSSEILAEFSPAELLNLRDDFNSELGEYISYEKLEPHLYEIFYTEGRMEMQFVVIEEEIAGLRFLDVVEDATDIEEAISDFRELPGERSLLLTKNGEEMHSINPEQKLAVGSTFKLAVLDTIQEEIETGNLSCSDVIELKPEDRSLPSGRLQDWPESVTFTVHSLAGRMISQSDNTATDMLFRKVGRRNIEERLEIDDPLLQTREFFILRDPEREEFVQEYREADRQEKYEILNQLENSELPGVEIMNEVYARDIEWYLNVEQLKRLMENVQHLDIMTINPGPVNSRPWSRVAYKGGASPGALNYTHYFMDEEGNEYFLSATWNHEQELEQSEFDRIYSGIVNSLIDN